MVSSPTFTAISLQTHLIPSSHCSGCGFFRNRKSRARAVQKDNEHETELKPRKRLTSRGRLLQQNSAQSLKRICPKRKLNIRKPTLQSQSYSLVTWHWQRVCTLYFYNTFNQRMTFLNRLQRQVFYYMQNSEITRSTIWKQAAEE